MADGERGGEGESFPQAVVVVAGGQAALALGYHLREEGVPSRVLA